MDWQTSIRNVTMVGPAYANRLIKLQIETVEDLLFHRPFRYENRSLISKIAQVQTGETVTVNGMITKVENIYTRGGMAIQKIQLTDGTATLEATWFNQPYLIKTFSQGNQLALSGVAKHIGTSLQLTAPEYELVRPGKPLLHVGRLVPVYPETAGVSSKWLRSRIYPLLTALSHHEYLPETITHKYQLENINQALIDIHFPQIMSDVERGRRRLAFDEVLLLKLRALSKRREWQQAKLRQPLIVNEEKILTFLESLPFYLTSAQKKAMREILTDFKKSTPMNRLLEGDVGSGKTVVAAIAMYVAYLNGFQSLMMVPTEILAQQHYQTLQTLLSSFQIKVGIQTGSVKQVRGKNRFDVLVGTHALLEQHLISDQIAFLVIDEQHRFGVRQRAIFREKGEAPHILTMTATPIPRTVALTLYGDLDLSVLDELPKNRLPVKTWVVPQAKRQAAYEWVKQQVRRDIKQQTFIICPFIDPSESIQTVKAATQEFNHLRKHVFPDLRLALLHGKQTSRQKNQLLRSFRKGDYHILVATPVVEVGIDIPTATIMLIEAAERFGLAQLHQLRGRVGRSDRQSYCLLFTTNHHEQSARLKRLEKAQSGFEVAELDFKLRGPGDMYGTLQHGREELKFITGSDVELIANASSEAEWLLTDPELKSYPRLKERLLQGTIDKITPD